MAIQASGPEVDVVLTVTAAGVVSATWGHNEPGSWVRVSREWLEREIEKHNGLLAERDAALARVATREAQLAMWETPWTELELEGALLLFGTERVTTTPGRIRLDRLRQIRAESITGGEAT